MTKNWYAIYTKPRWEKKVAELLSNKEIENYCPLNRVQRQWSDRKKMVSEPLFKSYVFVHVSDKEHLQVLQTNGVLSFVRWLGKPAIIRNEEIDTIKRFLNEHTNVQLEKVDIHINDSVRVLSGAFMMQEGKVLEVKGRTVKVLLPSLGYAMVAEVEKANVEKTNVLEYL